MDEIVDDSIIYPNLEAAATVCSKWCQHHGYTDHFYSSGSWWAFPLEYYSILLSIALLPDGCIAPHAHSEM